MSAAPPALPAAVPQTGAATPAPYRVGSGSRRLRIVCLSDTHGKHHRYADRIPLGDVLVHCGDSSALQHERDLKAWAHDLSTFFQGQPHRHKLLIAGNHELCLDRVPADTVQALLPHCTYLLDSSVDIDGVRFFGSPWNNIVGMAYGASPDERRLLWERIPTGTHVLLTHNPPWNTLDLAWVPHSGPHQLDCRYCDGASHPRYDHWGCWHLSDRIRAVRPLLHVFGHVHDAAGVTMKDGTLYVNAAQDLRPVPVVVDLYYE